ncbi:MAG TPA: dienelactone hydrolase family protein [Ruminiclostridium sp.]|nr:dienelactone hydrolase family protein [Ruminiclostridium sp.]
MLNILNNSEDLIIVLHEIYGVNRFIKDVAAFYASVGFDIVCPDLCGLGHPYDYSDQDAAYRNFSENVGFKKSAEIVARISRPLRRSYKHIFLLGFSIGASTAWLCSKEKGLFDGVICCYGSRIRDYLDITPACPVLLIFPSEEKSFNIKRVVGNIKMTNVMVHVLDGCHGFADPYSANYSKISAKEAFDLAGNFLNDIKSGKV